MIKKPDAEQLALKGMRVLEVGHGAALAYAGKLFSDFGAEVIKVESIEGDPWRQMPPFVNDSDGKPAESALFAWLNTNKRSVIIDTSQAVDVDMLRHLAASCDVVLDARALSEGLSVLKKPVWQQAEAQPSAQSHQPIEVLFTWFGETGPYKDFVANYATCRAMSGAVHGSGPVEGPPHMPHELHTGIVAGLGAFSLAIAAWIGRSQGSRRYVLSVHEAAFSTVEMEAGLLQDGRHAPRLGVNKFCATHPASILETKDGWIGIFTNTLPQWAGLCNAIGRPELGTDPRFSTGQNRMQHADEIDAVLKDAFLHKETQEWFELLTSHKHPAVIVPTMEQLLQQSVHRERNAFVPVQVAGVEFEAPVLPQRLDEAGPLLGGEAPLLGADTKHYREIFSTSSSPQNRLQYAPAKTLPLEGMRIIDLTMGWAGPFVTRMLADLGAEVIKVESVMYPDWWRGVNYTEEFYRDRLYEKCSHFNIMNRNKLGITLDLTQPEGKKLLRELVGSANAVIENYSAEVLPKLGLDYEALRKINPNIVMLSMPAFGLHNAWSNTRAYGGTLEQASGLPIYTGYADQSPGMTSYAYGDPIGGFNGTAAVLLGLLVQQATGKGRHINMSQVEGMLPLTAPFLIEQSLRGAVPERQGNTHSINAPHGSYPCDGADAWIVISIENHTQWEALCQVIERPDLNTTNLKQVEARRAHKDEIDEAIAQWTKTHSDEEALELLQSAGIPAGVVRSIPKLLKDKHLWERGFWHNIQRPYIETFISSSSFFRLEGEPMAMEHVAPTLGQHTAEVLRRVLGLEDEQLHLLEQQGVIGTEARPKL